MDKLEALWREKYKPLVFYANGFVKNDLLAEDIAIEAFTKLWKTGEWEWHQACSFLYKCARNSCIDHLRYGAIHDRIHGEIAYASSDTEDPDELDYDRLYAEYISAVHKVSSKLTPAQKTVFMRYLNGETTNEIAHDMGLSPQTIRNHKTAAAAVITQAVRKVL